MSFIFISYSRKDQAYVRKLAQALERNHLPFWLDDRVDYGTKWPIIIQSKLEACGAFLLVMSPRSYESDWVRNELLHAMECEKPIFPLLLEGRRWLTVASTQFVDVQGDLLPPDRFFRLIGKHCDKVSPRPSFDQNAGSVEVVQIDNLHRVASPSNATQLISPCIKVIGVGGGGGNAINRMIGTGLTDVEFWNFNTDEKALTYSSTNNTILIGPKLTRGKGSGGNPSIGQKAAEESRDEIFQAVKGADLVFVVAGMGNGTGTGASSVVAQVAKAAGALTVCVVTRPFTFEGRRRTSQTDSGISVLKAVADTIIIIPNDKLLSVISEQTPVQEAFRVSDEILRQCIQGISDIITIPGPVKVDFSDLRAVMTDAGSALIGVGIGTGYSRAREAVIAAISSPLSIHSIEDADSVIFHVAGGTDLTQEDIDSAAEIIEEITRPSANIIFGMVTDNRLQEAFRVTIIACGFSKNVDSR